MEISLEYIENNGIVIAELTSESILINNAGDALEILANAAYQGATCLILYKHQLNADFFDLSTRIAGDILQKFSNYRAKLAIVGEFGMYTSKSLKDFIYESNKSRRISFVPDRQKAIDILSA